jgi:hypothetical protein
VAEARGRAGVRASRARRACTLCARCAANYIRTSLSLSGLISKRVARHHIQHCVLDSTRVSQCRAWSHGPRPRRICKLPHPEAMRVQRRVSVCLHPVDTGYLSNFLPWFHRFIAWRRFDLRTLLSEVAHDWARLGGASAFSAVALVLLTPDDQRAGPHRQARKMRCSCPPLKACLGNPIVSPSFNCLQHCCRGRRVCTRSKSASEAWDNKMVADSTRSVQECQARLPSKGD